VQEPVQEWRLEDFDAVFIRKDPPFDDSYLSLTYLLEPLAQKTFVVNHPRGIRNANEKLFIFNFPEFCPPSLASSNPEEILQFQSQQKKDLVIKPLFEKGGQGVFLLKRSQRPAPALLEKASGQGKKMLVAQAFIPVRKGTGDKRILIWKEKVLGAFERIPRAGDFRSNLSLGGTFRACGLTGQEKKIVRRLIPTLHKEGLFLTGLDVRGEFLIEANVTSPAGLVELDQLGQKATGILAKDLINKMSF
jgi:glutathione synthase